MGREVDDYKTHVLTTISRGSLRPVIKRAQKIWRVAFLRCPSEPLAEFGVGRVYQGRYTPQVELSYRGAEVRFEIWCGAVWPISSVGVYPHSSEEESLEEFLAR